ncbi:hypothetical protein ACFLZ2_02530 [Candidatus Margulisiibacteriota bacterium]
MSELKNVSGAEGSAKGQFTPIQVEQLMITDDGRLMKKSQLEAAKKFIKDNPGIKMEDIMNVIRLGINPKTGMVTVINWEDLSQDRKDLIKDISAFKAFTDLRTAVVWGIKDADMSPLSKGLIELSITNIQMTEKQWAVVGRFIKLKRFYANGVGMSHIRPTSNMRDLEIVYVQKNPGLTSLLPLENCHVMEHVSVEKSGITQAEKERYQAAVDKQIQAGITKHRPAIKLY